MDTSVKKSMAVDYQPIDSLRNSSIKKSMLYQNQSSVINQLLVEKEKHNHQYQELKEKKLQVIQEKL